MGWKDLPSWLKGGVIATIIPLLGTLIFYSTDKLNSWFGFILMVTITAPVRPLMNLIGDFLKGNNGLITGLILLALFYFIIGSIVGWIVGKIKSKKGVKKK